MERECAPACKFCREHDLLLRCPIPDPKTQADAALYPGDLNKLFARIVRNAPGNKTLTKEDKAELVDSQTPEYTVVVHSHPSGSPAPMVNLGLDGTLPPWVVSLDNFLTSKECDRLIKVLQKYEDKPSEDDSVQSGEGASEVALCSNSTGCRMEEISLLLHERVAQLVDISAENSADLQLLKYDKGQLDNLHHDYIPDLLSRPCGPRLVSFLLFLSDVKGGGETKFPQLDVTVQPKKGRAIVWPLVKDSNPLKKDKRMYSQALPVEKGVKYVVKGWFHYYDYVEPREKGCVDF